MPALLLIAIPVIVVILFWGIMSLPDEELKSEFIADAPKPAPKSKPKKSKRK